MKALLYKNWGEIVVADVPQPEPAAGEILVRVEACGICGSEVECFKERLPRRQPPLVLGHEFCGTVAASGEGVDGFKEGDPILVNSVIPCRTCHACARGETNLCTGRAVFGMHRPGACAEFVAAPASVVYPRPANMDPVVGALVEPASNAVNVMSLLPGHPKKTVFVFGAGFIGLMVMQAAHAMAGAHVAVADISTERLAVASELGAELTVNPREQDAVAAGIRFSGADGIDYVVDAVGAAETKRQSLAMARPNGAVCWIGLRDNEMTLNSFDITNPQKAITGSYAAAEDEFLTAARLLSEGKLKPGRGVKTFPLEKAADAFMRMCEPSGDDIKAVIVP